MLSLPFYLSFIEGINRFNLKYKQCFNLSGGISTVLIQQLMQ